MVGFVIQGAFFGWSAPDFGPVLLDRTLPDRGTLHGSWFLLSLRGGDWRLRHASVVVFFGRATQGFAVPMLIAALAGSVSVIVALLVSPETKGKVFGAELMKL
jgi:MFS transporter, SHS family, lactate transporter